MVQLINWDIYEISTIESSIHRVMLRGRIRKFGILNGVNILVENSTDQINKVRFAVISKTDVAGIIKKIKEIIKDSSVDLVRKNIQNPVLSKLKVNQEERYTL